MADDNKPPASSDRFEIFIGPFSDWQFRETVNQVILDYDDRTDRDLCTGYRELPVRPQGGGWHIAEIRDRSTVWRRLVTVPGFTIDVGAA
jgi:hypothetical protein